jgi:putative membrane protein
MKLHRSIAAAIALLLLTAAGAHAATTSGLDKQYLTSAIQGDRFEIVGGKLAEQKGQNAKVKALGARLVKDHTKSLKESEGLARKLGIKPPKAPTPPERWELQIVAALSGQPFDHWYASLEVADHHQDIAEASDEVTDGTNRQVRSAAHTEIPTLRTHLRLSEEALKAVG